MSCLYSSPSRSCPLSLSWEWVETEERGSRCGRLLTLLSALTAVWPLGLVAGLAGPHRPGFPESLPQLSAGGPAGQPASREGAAAGQAGLPDLLPGGEECRHLMSSGSPQVPPAAWGRAACPGGVAGVCLGPHPGRIASRVCPVCSQHLDLRGEPGRLLTWWGQHRGWAARASSSLPAPA